MFKCKLCNDRMVSYEDLINHIGRDHDDMIPKDFSVTQYEYMLRKGKTHGSCVVCKRDTQWNEKTRKYHRFCDRSSCKETYIASFRKNMIGAYGKVHILDDPDHQRKMLANRSISGRYKWSDGVEIPYTGTYELDFLRFLDVFMEYESSDIMAPSPHTYYYMYKGEKKFYIPDFFIPSLNLEIEIKDGGSNPNNHGKIQAVDKEKEKLKDKVLMSQKQFSYVKLTDKNYDPFYEFLNLLKKQYATSHEKDKDAPIFIVRENLEVQSQPEDIVLESATSANDLVPVYILLTFTNTPVARMVRKYTGNPYSHASIAFDAELKEMYSFGRKSKWEWPTFITEDIMEGIYKDAQSIATYGAYVTYVTRDQLQRMRERLKRFEDNAKKMKYSFVGLVNFAFGKETHRENEYFCSQFVAEILQAGRPDVIQNHPSTYSPYSFSQLKHVYYVTHGMLKDYDGGSVERRSRAIYQNIIKGSTVTVESSISDDTEIMKYMDDNLGINGLTYTTENVVTELFYGKETNDAINKAYKSTDRRQIGFTLRNFDLIFSNIMKRATRTGNFEGIRPNLLKIVKRAKTTTELSYLKRDSNAGKAILKRLAHNRPEFKKEIDTHLEWISNEYMEAINQRMEEIKKTA